jgi:hypothetical protein
MNQFDKNIILTFKENNTTSIKEVLKEYQALLKSDKAFVQDFMGMFNIEFKIESDSGVRRLFTGDVKNTEHLKQSLSFGPGGNWTTDVVQDDDAIYNSESLFFAIALEYEELKLDVIETAKSIVSTMRDYNNTDYVWIDDMRLFGVDALYLVALKYPEYTYLLGQFFIPNWDHEHASGYENFLFNLVEKQGWSNNLIKAYIWCDNGHFRYFMFSKEVNYFNNQEQENQGLADYLKESPQAYEYFKEELINRFNTEPVLMHSSEGGMEERNPVVEFFLSLYLPISDYFDNDVDEYSEILHRSFIKDTLENDAFDLQELVLKSVKTPLVKYDKKNQERRESDAYQDKDKYRGDSLVDLKEFVLALPNGSDIWEYIDEGNQEEILETIQKTELIPIAKKQAHHFYFTMTYTTSPLDYEGGIGEELDYILSGVLDDLLYLYENKEGTDTIHQGGLIVKITVSKSGEDSSESKDKEIKVNQFLRILDVFYRLLGKQEICDDLRETITDGEDGSALISTEEFYKRYSTKGKAEEKKLSLNNYSFVDSHKSDKDSLRYIEAVITQNGREAFDCSQWEEPDLGRLTLAAYLINRDRENNIFDEKTEKLIEYMGEGPWVMAYEQLVEHLDLDTISDDDLKSIRDYFTVVPINPMQLLMNKGAGIKETPLVDQETILQLLEKHLYGRVFCKGNLYVNKYCEQQKGYGLFFYGDGFQHVILCCYWMGKFMSPQRVIADRIWKLLIELAPQRVIRQVGRLFSHEYSVVEFENDDQEERFYKDLERAKVPKEQVNAFHMSQVQNKHIISEPCDVKEYLYWLNLYDEIDSEETGMFAEIDKKKALALEKGLPYINEQARLKFYIDLALLNPRFPLQQEKDFKRCFQIFIKLNRMGEAPLKYEIIWEKTLAYLEGKLPYKEVEEIFELNISKHINFELSRTSNYSLDMFVWQLPEKQQQNLFTLLLNHSVRAYRILENNLFYSYLRHLVRSKEIRIEEYLRASPEQGGDDIETYRKDSYEYLYERIENLDIRKDYLIIFLLEKDLPYYKNLCVEMARDGIVEKKIELLSDSQRSQLINLFKEEVDAKELVRVFKNDKSRKVKALANSILNKDQNNEI